MKTKNSLLIYVKRGVYMLFLIFMSAQVYAGASTGDMKYVRWGHAATFMPSLGASEGVVLITGGYSDTTGTGKMVITDKAEVYSSNLKTYNMIPSPMKKARINHQALLLKNGKVLIIGGNSTSGITSSCEIFDPATVSFSFTDSMSYKRTIFIATLLSSGEVLVAGGDMAGTGAGNEAEIYDPATGKWRKVASMGIPRTGHKAVSLSPNPELKKDQILITGGTITFMGMTTFANNSAEVYDYSLNKWVTIKPMNLPRSYHITARLDGTHYGESIVLVAGGYCDSLNTGNIIVLKEAELYIPSEDKWVRTTSMSVPRVYFTSNEVGVCNTDVVVAGGFTSRTSLTASKSIEVFHFLATTPIWIKGPDMVTSRGYHTAVFIPIGEERKILVSGGVGTLFSPMLQKSELIP